jgi:hypothetical protein
MSAEILDRLSSLWLQHFPRCDRRAHWHLANLLRFEAGPLGATFSQAEGYLKAQIGADPENTRARLGELQNLKLAEFEDATLSSRTIIHASKELKDKYTAYYREVIVELLKCDTKNKINENIIINDKIERYAYTQSGHILRELNLGREMFIYKHLGSGERAIDANYAMRRRSHWTLFLTAWLHCVEKEEIAFDKNKEGCVIDQKILIADVWKDKGLKEGEDTMRNYISDLVEWGFFVRIGRSSYSITQDCFNHFSFLFDEVGALMRSGAEQIKQALPREVTILRAGVARTN